MTNDEWIWAGAIILLPLLLFGLIELGTAHRRRREQNIARRRKAPAQYRRSQ